MFLCIRLYVIGKEDRAEETHQGCLSFLFKSAWRKTSFFAKLTPFRTERGVFLHTGNCFGGKKFRYEGKTPVICTAGKHICKQ